MTIVSQVLPSFALNDAIGQETLEIFKILRNRGYDSRVFAENIDPRLLSIARPLKKSLSELAESDLVIFHYAIGSDSTQICRSLSCRMIILYHNVTPPEYFRETSSLLQALARRGREELSFLMTKPSLALGDSEYNRLELEKLGFKNTGVMPIILDYTRYDARPNASLLSRYDDDWINLMFLGRLAPNKKIEDVIKAFFYFKKCINSRSRLLILGSSDHMEHYLARLQQLVRYLNLQDVIFDNPRSDSDLVAYYKIADVYVCMSEHEGFCVPLLESMYFQVPIIAYKAAAVPYTLGNAGILVLRKDPVLIGELIQLIMEDSYLKSQLLLKQSQRIRYYDRSKLEVMLCSYVEQALHLS